MTGNLESKLFGSALDTLQNSLFELCILGFRSFHGSAKVSENLIGELFCGQLGPYFNTLPMPDRFAFFCRVMTTARGYLEADSRADSIETSQLEEQMKFVDTEIIQIQKKLDCEWARQPTSTNMSQACFESRMKIAALENDEVLQSELNDRRLQLHALQQSLREANNRRKDHRNEILGELCALLAFAQAQLTAHKIRLFDPGLGRRKYQAEYSFSSLRFCVNLFSTHGISVLESTLQNQLKTLQVRTNKSHASLDALKSTTTPSFGIEAQ